MSSKAQIEVIDFFVALGLFLIMLLVIIIEWNLYSSNLNDNIDYNTMLVRANQVADFLVTSEGIPANWTSDDDVQLPGLALIDRNISSQKVDYFIDLTSADVIEFFKLRSYSYNFSLVYVNGTMIAGSGQDLSTSNTTVNVRRYVTYGNRTAYLDFKLGE